MISWFDPDRVPAIKTKAAQWFTDKVISPDARR